MEILFLVPSLISPQCPDKLVPALCKLIERNTLLSYSSVLRQAAILRFLGPYKGLLQDSSLIINRMEEMVSLVEALDDDKIPKTPKPLGSIGGRSTEADKWTGKPETQKPDSRETPRGISFYSTISLEPTYLEIPLEGRPQPGSTETVSRVVRIGMKCVPYKVDGVEDILSALTIAKNRSYIQTYLSRQKGRLKRLITGKATDIKGMVNEFLNITPTFRELNNPKFLSKLMGSGIATYWSFLTVFTSHDFKGKNLNEIIWGYREIVNGGWGDIIIVDDERDIINFCTQRNLSCTQLNIDYLRELLNLDNVIDSDLFKRSSQPSSFFDSNKKVSPPEVFKKIVGKRS